MSIDLSGAGHSGSLTRRLAAACVAMDWDSIPIPTRNDARLVLLDTLGAMLSASRPAFAGTERMTRFVRSQSAGGPCVVVGTDLRADEANAALMNGYLAYAMDIESHHGPAVVHAAAGVLPAALAVAQQVGSTGSDLLTGVVLGIDVACRVSLALGPNDLYARGFHPTSVGGIFGATVAAGWLQRLDCRRMENALGLAANQACGLLAWASDQTEESRPLNPGLAARGGVTAARLAALGFGAPQSIFDASAKYNAFRAWSLDGAGSPAQLLHAFGERFAIDGLTIKRHASCAFLHPAVDGLLSILEEQDPSAGDILGITMRFPSAGAPIIDGNELRSHRAQYILPVAAVRRRVAFEDVIVDRSSEEPIRSLIEATKIVHDDDLDRLYPERYATIVEVDTRGHGRPTRRVDWAKGTPQNPMARQEILDKYRALVAPRLDPAHADRILSLVEDLESRGKLAELFEALSAPFPSSSLGDGDSFL